MRMPAIQITHACGHAREHSNGIDAAEIARRAALPCGRCRDRAKLEAFRAYQATPAGQAAEAEREAERRSAERRENERILAEAEAERAWPGTRRVAYWIEARLRRAGLAVERHEAATGSVYLAGEGVTVRISDHEPRPFGGYAGQDEYGNDATHGAADVNVWPMAADWRAAAAEFSRLVRAEAQEASDDRK